MTEKTYISQFSPDQPVFHVALVTGIREGVIDKIQILDDDSTTIAYFVLFGGATRAIPITTGLFAALGDAQAGSLGGGALEAYQLMLQA